MFCVVFGFLIMIFRNKLEALTHGAEDKEREEVVGVEIEECVECSDI